MKYLFVCLATISFFSLGCADGKMISRSGVKSVAIPAASPSNIQSIRSVSIQNLNIDSLIGLPLAGGPDWNARFVGVDSLVIDLDNVPPNDYEIKDGMLTLAGLHIPTITVNPSNEPFSNKSPYRISELRFKKIVVLRNGHQIELDTFLTYDQKRFHPGLYSLVNANVAEKRTKINSQVQELEDRLETIKRKIKELKQKQPDHAADMLMPSLDKIKRELIQIKEWHRQFTESLPILNAALDKLFSINMTFDDMEFRLDNPQEAAIVNTKILFSSGEYKIAAKNQIAPLDKVAEDIFKRTLELQKERPERTIILNIKVTGYADEQDIGKLLEQELLSIPSEIKQDTMVYQDYLNVLLSEQRSLSVNAYLLKKIQNSTVQSNFIIHTQSVGKGRDSYPSHIPQNSCPNDCPHRRVVIISEIAFSEK